MIDAKDRNRIYREILAEFDKMQNSNGNTRLSFGICAYFITGGNNYDINNFPEIIKYKPWDYSVNKYGGYWFSPNGIDAITIRRNILLQAIKETETKTNNMRQSKVIAIFKGQNGSCGYETKKEYTLVIRHHIGALIQIEDINGGGWCEYGSMVSFLENWDNIRASN